LVQLRTDNAKTIFAVKLTEKLQWEEWEGECSKPRPRISPTTIKHNLLGNMKIK